MKAAKSIVKFIGWALIIAGLIMRFTGVSFSGSFNTKNGSTHSHVNSTMDGKVVIFFGLVFLILHYFAFRAKDKSVNP